MSAENDLALAYHMGYDDALAKRRPDASKTQVLAPYDLDAENARLRAMRDTWAENDAKLRELVRDLITELAPPALTVDEINCGTIYRARIGHFKARARELGMEVDG